MKTTEQEKVLKWLAKSLPEMINEYNIPEITEEEKKLDVWVDEQAEKNAKARYHLKVDKSILMAYKHGFIRGFYFLYNHLKNAKNYDR